MDTKLSSLPMESIFATLFRSITISKVMLVIANVVPLIGVCFLHWSVFSLLIVYWGETAIIGFFNILKMITVSVFASLFFVPFFVVHFGIFMFGHALLIVGVFGTIYHPEFAHQSVSFANLLLILYPFRFAYAVLFFEHGISFAANFIGQKEYVAYRSMKDGMGALMMAPYSRVVLMHITGIVGAFLLTVFHAPLVGLVFFVCLKVAIDFAMHHREHASLQISTSLHT